MRFHLVDVFAERRYAGNQLAVVESRGELSDEAMQAVAAEIDYSETTFVESLDAGEDGYEVRIFTPESEIPFAGHPTLGTAAVLRKRADAGEELALDLGVGRVPVRVEREGGSETLWMTQQPPEFGASIGHERAADVLSLDTDDLDRDWPVEVVSTGLATVVVPLAGREALERCAIDRAAYDALVEEHDATNVLAFCSESRETDNDLAVRVFAPALGVSEDPATGSSNGCLAGYLAHHGYGGDDGDGDVDLRVEQGHGLGRPSLLRLRVDSDGRVAVGGRVVPVARGDLLGGDGSPLSD